MVDKNAKAQAGQRPRKEEAARFGSRTWARKLMETRGQVCPSGRHGRVTLERHEAAVVTTSVGASAETGRRRLLPFELRLASAAGSLLLFPAGPFGELRCYQRRVSGRHSLEYLTCLEPRDFGSEAYEPFGRLDMSDSLPFVPIHRQQRFQLDLRARGLRSIPRARVRGQRVDAEGLPREGLLELEAALDPQSGRYSRGGQPDLEGEEVRELISAATDLERIAWLEEAFRTPTRPGEALHRYYLASDLTVYLVRQVGLSKTLTLLPPRSQAAQRGLLIHTRRVLVAA